MSSKKILITDTPDRFAVLTAVWILACNDENPIMSYKGIQYRLNLPDDFDVKELVHSRGELFRKGLHTDRLDDWKSKLIKNHKNRSSWIRALGSEENQIKTIERLDSNDVFRSQFRAVEGAPKSPIEIIDWGLQHIDRIRKASMETKEQNAKSKEVQLVLIISALNAVISILALFTK